MAIITSLNLVLEKLTMTVGDREFLKTELCPSSVLVSECVQWTSNKPSVVSIVGKDSGIIEAVGTGKATITAEAKDGSGKKDSCTITVVAATDTDTDTDTGGETSSKIFVESVSLTDNNITLTEGQKQWLNATVCPYNADNTSLTWTVSPSNVAKYENSYIYALKEGTATITAKAKDGSGKQDSCTINVLPKTIPVQSVSLNKSNILLTEGCSTQLSATVSPSNATNKKIVWVSNDSSIASVDSSGWVTANSSGCTRIIARAAENPNILEYCYVEVDSVDDTVIPDVIPVQSVLLNESNILLTEGCSTQLSATVSPSNATNKKIVWVSNDSSIASVDSSGWVTANSSGCTRIIARAAENPNILEYCYVEVDSVDDTVIPDVTPVESVSLDYIKYPMKPGEKKTLYATVCPPDAYDKSIYWYSSDRNVATVTQAGEVTAHNSGKATITAESRYNSQIRAACEISVSQPRTDPSEEKTADQTGDGVVADPVDIYTGAHLLQNTFISLFGGQKLSVKGHYNSTLLVNGSMGIGWSHNYEKHIEMCECEALVYSSPSSYARYAATDISSVYTCTTTGKNGYTLTVNATNTYPYCVNCNFEKYEYYDSEGRLRKITDHLGFETNISYSDTVTTITDNITGKSIYLEKDVNNKISHIYDDDSRHVYLTYRNNCLSEITDVNNNTLKFTYDSEGKVLTGTDAKNTCYFTNTYDEFGRVIQQVDGVGSTPTFFDYGINGVRTVTDRNGNQSTRVFNNDGLLTKYTDANGNVKTYAYDENNNLIEETDGLGNCKKTVYNNFNKPAEITGKNGSRICFEYDSAGNIIKIIYPETNGSYSEESFVYNLRNQLIQHTDLRGTVTEYTYDVNGMPASKKTGSKNAARYVYENGMLISETDALGNTVVFAYNSLGQPIAKTDAQNNITEFEYDAKGNLLKITDAYGKSIINTYDSNAQKISTTDANGNRTQYTYNGNMKNDSVVLPDGNTVRYIFDGEDRVKEYIDQENNVTITEYDKAGRPVLKRSPDGAAVMFEYDNAGNVVKETNPKGAVVTKTYDEVGNVLTETDDNGNMIRYQYDAMSRLIRKVNAVSGATVYTYSPAGDLLSETDAMGGKKTYSYDAYGNKLTAADAKGNITFYTYDENNNLLTVKDPLNNTTTYTYNSLNQLVSVTNAKGNTITYGYDALGRRTTVTDAKGNVFTNVYDANGNVLKTLDAKGNTVSETIYNCLNLPATVIDASGNRTVYAYNGVGKVSSTTDSLGNVNTFLYDAVGRNIQSKDAMDSISTAEYDVMGNITKLTGPLGGSTSYSYDDMGRLVSETTTSGGTVSYGYNELSVKETLTNARGQNRKFFYDALGRITGYIGEEDSVSYTYDANGNVLTVTDKNGTVSRTYDALNRVSAYTDTYGNTVRYTYDSVGNLERIFYPDNTAITYAYDENNNLITVTDWSGRVTSYTYDANNKVIIVAKPDGSVTTTVYDDKQRIVSSITRTESDIVISGFRYTYDTLGRIVSEENLANDTEMCYTYDKLSRVKTRQTNDMCSCYLTDENYSYDKAGNITEYYQPGVLPEGFGYDKNNKLVSSEIGDVGYDADGNMVSVTDYCGVTSSFKYDSANRLVKTDTHTYTYNAEDVRIRMVYDIYDTKYTYNTNTRLSQLLMKNTNGIVTKYVYGHGLIGEEREGTFNTYHFDYRGSTVAITNENCVVTDRFEYDTYGRLTYRTGSTDVIFMYNGRDGVISDTNGLIYMRARYYSTSFLRFINADILHGNISDSTSLNRYAYVNGNPVSFVDPFGLSKEERDSASSDNFWNIFKNDDDTYSLYDNRRHQPNNVYHEQILVVDPSSPSFSLKEGNIGLGGVEGNFYTGGWEWKYADLSLLDFGHVEAGAELKNGKFKLGAMASAWSPSFSVKVLGVEIEIGAEVGAVGAGAKASTKGFSLNLAFLFGGKLSVSW